MNVGKLQKIVLYYRAVCRGTVTILGLTEAGGAEPQDEECLGKQSLMTYLPQKSLPKIEETKLKNTHMDFYYKIK